MKKRLVIILLLFFNLLWLGCSFASTPQERRIEEEKRTTLRQTELKALEGQRKLLFDYGGWINLIYINYHNDDNNSSVADLIDDSLSLDVRLWTKATYRPSLGKEHSIYLRLKNEYLRRWSYDPAKDNDGPHLDMGYLTLDFNPLWIQTGRQYFSLGQGIAYSDVHDGIQLLGLYPNWNFKVLISQTLPHEENIDYSVPGYDKESERNFYGMQLNYLGLPNHNLYGFFVIQRDDSDEDPEDVIHQYTYDSEYFGLGGDGNITSSLRYWFELIGETGKSFIYQTGERKDVGAWAVDFGLSCVWQMFAHPNFSFEYALGSGDSDRSNVTNTYQGNSSGNDRNFLYFGYFPTSYALAPRLSNIHIVKFSGSLLPLEKINLLNLNKLSTELSFYYFCKYRKTGGIYDTDATESKRDIGREIDLTLSWKPTSDLNFSFLYGYFIPADAYPTTASDAEIYIYTSITLTF
jgi:hypothetical protein